MNKVTNRQVICDTLLAAAKEDRNIIVACSDSRGSGSMTAFFEQFPAQSVEVGIAEQDLVSISAGLAACGKKVFAVSPACFLSTRSYEQAKVDVAYAETNVTLVGISGGISYGALGMTHHSLQDIAAMAALPGMRVYLPSDRFQTKTVVEELLQDEKPAYIRVSRSASEDLYSEDTVFSGGAKVLKEGKDVLFVACGELVAPCLHAAELLEKEGISAGVVDAYRVKPLNEELILKAAEGVRLVAAAEEHSPYGGLFSMTAQLFSSKCPKKVVGLTLPDGHIVTGTQSEAFQYYGLTAEGIARRVKKELA
ncbi:MAG TPA: transketolase family protein [Candidatus Gallimonas gallistercoris]|uniref:Transketolase family protein n=1 Tax=Candidatus Gallimonas gallistercoris TaxID=2838602 RepID=A0A9D2H435_9FIRM|nr:transketolase family protein [Candidatus Gallimonas gallistercoris]